MGGKQKIFLSNRALKKAINIAARPGPIFRGPDAILFWGGLGGPIDWFLVTDRDKREM